MCRERRGWTWSVCVMEERVDIWIHNDVVHTHISTHTLTHIYIAMASLSYLRSQSVWV